MCRSEGGLPQDVREKIALFASLPVDAVVSGARRRQHLQGAARTTAPRASTTSSSSTSASRPPAPDLSGWERLVRRAGEARAAPAGADRARRQVRPARGRVHVRRRGAAPLGLPARLRDRHRLGRLRDARRRRGPRAARARRRHPDPGRLRRARHRGQDPGRADRARAEDPVPRRLPRHADGGRRLRAPRGRHGRAPTRRSSTPRRRTR